MPSVANAIFRNAGPLATAMLFGSSITYAAIAAPPYSALAIFFALFGLALPACVMYLIIRSAYQENRAFLSGSGCPRCGYDLSGLRRDTCPECGCGLSHRR